MGRTEIGQLYKRKIRFKIYHKQLLQFLKPWKQFNKTFLTRSSSYRHYRLQESQGTRIESAGVACHVGNGGKGVWERREYIYFVLLISACVPLNDEKIKKKTTNEGKSMVLPFLVLDPLQGTSTYFHQSLISQPASSSH